MFSHEDIHKGMWISLDGTYLNQIVHELINQRFTNYITDVRTYREADSDWSFSGS